ncbi:P1 family peptidase [Nocardioides alcanivorans]|uniref:P1 family peptidase n=1 Tax=Nocardioides alcanivorans TaxID=2897352 RepID=UPI0035E2F7B9
MIATDATLTEAQCQKMAGIGHDGLARAINRCTPCSTATPSCDGHRRPRTP